MIRKAKIEDSNNIAKLIIRGWQTAYKGLINQEFLDSMKEDEMSKGWKKSIFSQNESNNIYVYEKENKILGVIRFGKVADQNDINHNAEIHVLYVEPKLKRNGIGSKLFDYAKNYFIEHNMKKLIIWCLKGNEPSIEFYKKMGGEIISEREAKVHNIELEEVGLEYNLEDKIKLIIPTKEYENQAIEYRKEHFDNGEKTLHACSKWDRMDNYDEWLKLLKSNLKKETVQDNYAVTTQFFGVRERDNKIVGMINIRHELANDFLRNYGGNIGYGIRPTERRKGYATQMLEQALKYCKEELNLEKVMLGCYKENEASKRTILNAGGILEKELETKNGKIAQVYWIKL